MSSGGTPDRRILADRFLILEALDAEGHVLKAHDRRTRGVVVLRFLPPAAMPGFQRGYPAARSVRHPNVAALLDVGQEGMTRFVVREYAEGSDLERIVRDRGALTLDQAIDVVTQAARGLEAAHARGIVHGGLKPSRLVLETDGTVRVLGVGLSSLFEPEVDPRAADFRAPELAVEPRPVDVRADVYSLGGILYFLLTGRAPFAGETLEDRSRAHREHPAPGLRILRPDVPSTVEATYQRMLAKRPDDRPASMVEVIAMLRPPQAPGGDDAGHPMPRETPRKQPAARRPGPDVREFGPGDESKGAAIGPEFDLAGLGLERRPGMETGTSRRGPIGLRIPGAGHRERSEPPGPRRWMRPAIALGIAALAVVAAVVVRSAFRPGGDGSQPAVARPNAGDQPGATAAGKADRTTRGRPQPPPGPEWVTRAILDGEDASDWMLTSKRPVPRKHLQPDGLNPHGTGSYLVAYRHKLGDFILDFDYKLGPGCRSGVFLRVGDLDDPVNTGIEVAIRDSTGTSDEDSGAIHGLVAPSGNLQKPAGQWNHMTITAEGPLIVVSLNDRDVSRIHLDQWTEPGRRPGGGTRPAPARLPRRGYLGFQDLVGDWWVKDVVVRIPKDAPDRPAPGPDR